MKNKYQFYMIILALFTTKILKEQIAGWSLTFIKDSSQWKICEALVLEPKCIYI